MFIEPKACWQHIDLSERRTAIEFAEEMGKLVDVRYPEAEKKITVFLHYPPVAPQLLAALYLLPGYAPLYATLLERPA